MMMMMMIIIIIIIIIIIVIIIIIIIIITIMLLIQARSLVSKWGVRFNSGGAIFRSRKFASAEGASFSGDPGACPSPPPPSPGNF